MKKILSFCLILVCAYTHAQNQTEDIDKLCQEYDDQIQKAVDEEVDFLPPHFTIKSILQERAIGPVERTIKLYFDEIEEIESSENGDEYSMPYEYAILRKAVTLIETGSYTIKTEQYFDEHGYLIKFKYIQEGYECYEELTYFKEHTPIRITHITELPEKCPNNEDEIESYDKTELNEQEIATAKLLLKQAEKYREMMQNQYSLIKN